MRLEVTCFTPGYVRFSFRFLTSQSSETWRAPTNHKRSRVSVGVTSRAPTNDKVSRVGVSNSCETTGRQVQPVLEADCGVVIFFCANFVAPFNVDIMAT